MDKFTLEGLVKVATYPHRVEHYDTRVMFYNELGEHFVLCVDEEQNCCEDFNFTCVEYWENEIVSTNGITIEFIEDENFECYDCGGAYKINIVGTEKTYNLYVSNDHNGYYSHKVSLMKDTNNFVWEVYL